MADVVLSCERCRSRWEETDPAALAGLRSGYGVVCPNCRAVLAVDVTNQPRLRIVRDQAS
jgi:hypothetical protein